MTTRSRSAILSGERWLLFAVVPTLLMAGGCTSGGDDTPDETPGSNPVAASSAPSAAFAFRDDLCDKVDWTGFKDYGSIEPTDYDVDLYEEPTGRMECVRFFVRPDRDDVGGDALTVRVKLGDPEDHRAELEELRSKKGWAAAERAPWEACARWDDDLGLEYTCADENLLITFSSDTVIITPDAGYTDAIFAFMDGVRALTAA